MPCNAQRSLCPPKRGEYNPQSLLRSRWERNVSEVLVVSSPARARVASMTGPRSSRRSLRWARRALAAVALGAVALVPSLPPRGPVLLEVQTPASGAHVGIEGIELLVSFPPDLAFGE